MVIEILEEMSSYGEFEALKNEKNQGTLQATTSGTYYSIPMKESCKNNQKYLSALKSKCLPYPDKEELEFRLGVQTEVMKSKNRVKKALLK